MIDCDMHLFEPPDMWQEYCDPKDRNRVLRMETDDLGYVWLVSGEGGERLTLAEPHQPRHPRTIGEYRQRQKDGLPSTLDYPSFSAPYSDPKSIIDHLDRTGFRGAVLFPNYGIVWERKMQDDRPASQANMGAWNRWIAQIDQPRLHPVGHVTLEDREWLETQLARLSDHGIRLALIPPALVDGRRLSDPDLDWAWSAFVDHGITPVFHVADQRRPFDDAWYGEDIFAGVSPLSSIFIWTAPALALTDLIINGVLDRHPDLRLGVMELSAVWVPLHLQMMDGGYSFAGSFNGERVPLSMRPSDFFRRQVRVAAFSYEMPRMLIDHAGDIFMACSDYPHTEGTDQALDDYRKAGVGPEDQPGLFQGNIEFLLRASA